MDERRATAALSRAGAADADALYDTAGEVVAFEPGPIVTMYTCGITPYDATHLGPRRHVRQLRRAAAPAPRPRPRDPVRAQHHRRRRRPAAQGPRARRALPRPGRRRDGPVRRRHEGARHARRRWSEPRATSAIADIRGFIGMVLDRGHAYQAGRRRVLRRRLVRRFGSVSQLRPRRDARARRRARRQPRRPQQARPARLRALAAVARTTSRRGSRCGARAGPAGTSSARPWPCASSAPPSTCTAAAAT